MQPIVEYVPEIDGQSFAYRWFRRPRFAFDWHVHPEAELTWIISGRGDRYVGDSVESFEVGDLVLLAPDLPHCWYGQPSRGQRCVSVVIQWRADCLGPGFFNLPETRRIGRLMERAKAGLVFTGAAAGEVGRKMEAMHQHRPPRRLALFLEILDQLAGTRTARALASTSYTMPIDPRDRQRIQQIQELLHRHLDETVDVEQAAAAIHLSPSAFSRFFKRATGLTFVEYQQSHRVARACAMLIQTELSITEVAFSSGFSNISYFNRLFRRLKGVTPRDFRRRYRNANHD